MQQRARGKWVVSFGTDLLADKSERKNRAELTVAGMVRVPRHGSRLGIHGKRGLPEHGYHGFEVFAKSRHQMVIVDIRHPVTGLIAKPEIFDASANGARCMPIALNMSLSTLSGQHRGVTLTTSQPRTNDQNLDTQWPVRRSARLALHPVATRSKGRCRR